MQQLVILQYLICSCQITFTEFLRHDRGTAQEEELIVQVDASEVKVSL